MNRLLTNFLRRRAQIAVCLIIFGGIFQGLPSAVAQPTQNPPAPRGSAALRYSFSLPAADGRIVSVGVRSPGAAQESPGLAASSESRVSGTTVVCFLGTECPLVKLYSQRLSAMADEFSKRGVRFVGITSNRQDSSEDIRLFLSEHPLAFPLLRDESNVVADAYGATRTPEIFVLDDQLQLLYQGRVDDQYVPGASRGSATRQDLRIALEEIVSGRPVTEATTKAVGCLIGKIPSPPPVKSGSSERQVTYSRDVSRVLREHCTECHRSGEIGPFALDNYEDAAGWAETCLEVIANGRMPPWGADPSVGHFANARAMSEADRQVLSDWVRQGLQRGDPADLPEPVAYVEGWQLERQPDLVIPMRSQPYQVAAEGTIEYQYFVVDPGFEEDRWVTGAQIIPGNRSVVHHAIVFIRPPDGSAFRGIGWLTAYVPGQRLTSMPPGHARKVPKGSRLVFQMHYTASGSPQEDITEVGLLFAPAEEISHEVITLIGIDQEFEIPPHAPDHVVSGRVRGLPKHGQLLGMAPHMHVRGKRFELFGERDGQVERLLYVPQYDFNWQHSYVLSSARPISDFDAIRFKATFDNSADNPFNPDPSQWVNWGDQTWEEMAVVFLEVAEPLESHAAADSALGSATPAVDSAALASDASVSSEAQRARDAAVQRFVDDFFKQLDQNGDGVVVRSEFPLALKNRMGRFDEDGDGRVTPEDVRQVAERRVSEGRVEERRRK